MQLFGGMFSTVAWSIATMVLLTLTSTALPTAPTDGLIHPRSDETGTLIRRTNRPGWGDDLEKQKNAATNYMRCLAAWASQNSRGTVNPLRRGLPSDEEENASFILAEQECYEQAVKAYGVEPNRKTKAEIDTLLATFKRIVDDNPTEFGAIRDILPKDNPDDNPGQQTGGQDRGGGPNINRMTLIRPSNRSTGRGVLNSMKSAFFKSGTGGRHRGAPFGGPVLRPMPFAPR